jgi:stage V sporulation protein G
MPSKKRKDGTYKDVAHPIDKETRAMIETKILQEYERTVAPARSQEASSAKPRFGND